MTTSPRRWGGIEFVSVGLRGDLKQSITEHRQILDAVVAGEVERAVELAHAHVRVPQRAIEEISDDRWEELRGLGNGT